MIRRVAVKKFKKALRASQHNAIANCYREYNAKDGRVLTLQSGSWQSMRITQQHKKLRLQDLRAQCVSPPKNKWVRSVPSTMR